MNFENPFSDYGKIVHGERFIGRGQIIGVVESRIIQPTNPGNLAIVGVHRIGKSSLVYKTIVEQRDKLTDKGILPIWRGLSSYDQSSEFFRSLVDEYVSEMEDLGWLTERIQRSANRALESNAS
ncbi:MAG: ATP-binding protein, partial [Gemmatimonadetes bacterium]|nr:ATP-binding protein [Gemmatimonadota bacterium]